MTQIPIRTSNRLDLLTMTTSQNQIKKINDMWAKGERNKSSIMKAVGVSRKTLLKYLNQQIPVQQTTPSESANTAQEPKPIQMPQPVQATQSPEQLTYETHHPRKWTWEEIEEYTRPDPETEPVYDYRFDNLGPPPWEQEQQMQPPYYQYPEEDFQLDPQYNQLKDQMTWIEGKLIKWEEENRRESEEILRNMNELETQIKNEQPDPQNLQPQQQDIESNPNKATPVIEKDKSILFPVDSIFPNPEETNNQNISSSFIPTTKIILAKPDEKHHTAEASTEEAIPPTIEKEKKMWEETAIKTTSKEDNKSEIATSKNDTNNLQDRQNAEITSVVPLKRTSQVEKKEETDEDYLEIPTEQLVTALVYIGARFVRFIWENKQNKIQFPEQRNNKNLTNYQITSNHEPIILQPVEKKDNKKRDQQNYTITYITNW